MCGIAGVFGLGGPVDLTDRDASRMRDTMLHRGPDGAGLWRCPWVVLAHRRLAVIAPGLEGHQPMVTPDGRYALVYNGELYNDDELRAELEALGCRFRTSCDTETVLLALAAWGRGAVDKLRGMFAFCFVDRDDRRVILARDPLGIKPLYAARVTARTGPCVVFASEPAAVLAHPDMRCDPDLVTVSAYLTTLRPTLGSRTLFEGVETLLPGETRVYSMREDTQCRRYDAWADAGAARVMDTREVVRDSVARHLRTDVPICSLLSGGLDSAIVTTVAAEHIAGIRTYCAGARVPGVDQDFRYAAEVAQRLGVEHREVEVTRDGFVSAWSWMVDRSGVPLSTPNEVAIYKVAASLRADGHVVTISGEGADELFGGYAPAMRGAAEHIAALDGGADTEGGLFHLRTNAWVGSDVKRRVLRERAWNACGEDAELIGTYRRSFDKLREACVGLDPLEPHLRFLRLMNLPNLLRRLDSSTMLASVEGRTPLADIEVARLAERLPMSMKYVSEDPPGTKIALRRAFGPDLPAGVLRRPKASFPLPFQQWTGGHAEVLRTGSFAGDLFTDEASQTVSAAPEALWNLAWPMLNIALWGERWWGSGAWGWIGPVLEGAVS